MSILIILAAISAAVIMLSMHLLRVLDNNIACGVAMGSDCSASTVAHVEATHVPSHNEGLCAMKDIYEASLLARMPSYEDVRANMLRDKHVKATKSMTLYTNTTKEDTTMDTTRAAYKAAKLAVKLARKRMIDVERMYRSTPNAATILGFKSLYMMYQDQYITALAAVPTKVDMYVTSGYTLDNDPYSIRNWGTKGSVGAMLNKEEAVVQALVRAYPCMHADFDSRTKYYRTRATIMLKEVDLLDNMTKAQAIALRDEVLLRAIAATSSNAQAVTPEPITPSVAPEATKEITPIKEDIMLEEQATHSIDLASCYEIDELYALMDAELASGCCSMYVQMGGETWTNIRDSKVKYNDINGNDHVMEFVRPSGRFFVTYSTICLEFPAKYDTDLEALKSQTMGVHDNLKNMLVFQASIVGIMTTIFMESARKATKDKQGRIQSSKSVFKYQKSSHGSSTATSIDTRDESVDAFVQARSVGKFECQLANKDIYPGAAMDGIMLFSAQHADEFLEIAHSDNGAEGQVLGIRLMTNTTKDKNTTHLFKGAALFINDAWFIPRDGHTFISTKDNLKVANVGMSNILVHLHGGAKDNSGVLSNQGLSCAQLGFYNDNNNQLGADMLVQFVTRMYHKEFDTLVAGLSDIEIMTAKDKGLKYFTELCAEDQDATNSILAKISSESTMAKLVKHVNQMQFLSSIGKTLKLAPDVFGIVPSGCVMVDLTTPDAKRRNLREGMGLTMRSPATVSLSLITLKIIAMTDEMRYNLDYLTTGVGIVGVGMKDIYEMYAELNLCTVREVAFMAINELYNEQEFIEYKACNVACAHITKLYHKDLFIRLNGADCDGDNMALFFLEGNILEEEWTAIDATCSIAKPYKGLAPEALIEKTMSMGPNDFFQMIGRGDYIPSSVGVYAVSLLYLNLAYGIGYNTRVRTELEERLVKAKLPVCTLKQAFEGVQVDAAAREQIELNPHMPVALVAGMTAIQGAVDKGVALATLRPYAAVVSNIVFGTVDSSYSIRPSKAGEEPINLNYSCIVKGYQPVMVFEIIARCYGFGANHNEAKCGILDNTAYGERSDYTLIKKWLSMVNFTGDKPTATQSSVHAVVKFPNLKDSTLSTRGTSISFKRIIEGDDIKTKKHAWDYAHKIETYFKDHLVIMPNNEGIQTQEDMDMFKSMYIMTAEGRMFGTNTMGARLMIMAMAVLKEKCTPEVLNRISTHMAEPVIPDGIDHIGTNFLADRSAIITYINQLHNSNIKVKTIKNDIKSGNLSIETSKDLTYAECKRVCNKMEEDSKEQLAFRAEFRKTVLSRFSTIREQLVEAGAPADKLIAYSIMYFLNERNSVTKDITLMGGIMQNVIGLHQMMGVSKHTFTSGEHKVIENGFGSYSFKSFYAPLTEIAEESMAELVAARGDKPTITTGFTIRVQTVFKSGKPNTRVSDLVLGPCTIESVFNKDEELDTRSILVNGVKVFGRDFKGIGKLFIPKSTWNIKFEIVREVPDEDSDKRSFFVQPIVTGQGRFSGVELPAELLPSANNTITDINGNVHASIEAIYDAYKLNGDLRMLVKVLTNMFKQHPELAESFNPNAEYKITSAISLGVVTKNDYIGALTDAFTVFNEG